jgi:hypothetical protein
MCRRRSTIMTAPSVTRDAIWDFHMQAMQAKVARACVSPPFTAESPVEMMAKRDWGAREAMDVHVHPYIPYGWKAKRARERERGGGEESRGCRGGT